VRLSFFLSTLWLSGGVKAILETANRLAARGHGVCFVVPGGTTAPEVRSEMDARIEVREVSPLSSQSNPLLLGRLVLEMAKSAPPSDILISTHTPTTLAVLIAAHLLKKGRPVWYCQDYDLMFQNRPAVRWLLHNALRWHTCAIVVSHALQEELQAYVPGKPIYVSGDGLSHPELLKPCAPAERAQLHGPQATILYLGDIRPRKGWDDFLKAAELVYQQFPNLLLQIVSKEPCEIQTQVPYEFRLRPSDAELARLMAMCDVFVSASWWEGFGLPPLEAMACGAPVVMTDSHGGREYAKPGENCLMVPPRDPSALAQAVLQVLRDPAISEHFRRAGPLTARQFTWEKSVDRFEEALRTVIKV